jgi:hypothetical protein
MFRLTIILVFLFYFSLGNSQTYFNKKYDLGGFPDVSQSIVTTNNGYVVCANGYNSSTGYLGVCLLFLDPNGDTINTKWITKEYYGYYDGLSGCFRKYSSGGFYLVGSIKDTSGIDYALLYRFNESGDTILTKKYGNGTDFYAFYHGRETNDKGFILAGTRTVGTNGQGILIKTDSVGNIQWQQNYGGSGRDFGTSVLPLSDGRYLLGGSTETLPCGNVLEDQAWLLKANTNGSQNWSNCYGGANELDGPCYPVFEFSNGDIAVVGAYASPYRYPYVYRINPSGSIINDDYIEYSNLGYFGYLSGAIEGDNFDILAVGGYHPLGTDFGLFVRYSENIDSLWYRTYTYNGSSGSYTNYLSDIDTALGGGYVMCGTTDYGGDEDIWVIKVDNHGCLFDPACWLPGAYEEDKYSAGINDLEKESYFTVYPNPNNGRFTLENKIGIKSEMEIRIYNPIGELLFSKAFDGLRTELDISNLASGIYFITVNDDNGISWKTKIVKE